jgi:hypothetical protein
VAEHQETIARKVPTLTWSGTDLQFSEYVLVVSIRPMRAA